MARNRRAPDPDLGYLNIWYRALKEPLVLDAANKKAAVRMCFLLNMARKIDERLYEMQHASKDSFPLKYLYSYYEKNEDGTYNITVEHDVTLLGALNKLGVIVNPAPVDWEAAWRECRIRVMKYEEADYYRRVQTGQLRPQDLFPDEKDF